MLLLISNLYEVHYTVDSRKCFAFLLVNISAAYAAVRLSLCEIREAASLLLLCYFITSGGNLKGLLLAGWSGCVYTIYMDKLIFYRW